MNVGDAWSTYWAPVINLAREPRWGRNIETPGEDPYLTGEYAAAFVGGFERNPDDPTHRPLPIVGRGAEYSRREILAGSAALVDETCAALARAGSHSWRPWLRQKVAPQRAHGCAGVPRHTAHKAPL